MSDFRPKNDLFAQKFKKYFSEKVSRGANTAELVRSWNPNEVPTETRDQYLSLKKKVPGTDPSVRSTDAVLGGGPKWEKMRTYA